MFSATIPKSLHPFLNKYLENPEFVEIEHTQKNKKNIEFYLIPTKGEDKVEKTLRLIDILNPYLSIVFCNSRESAESYPLLFQKHLTVQLTHPHFLYYYKRRYLNMD